MFFITLTLQATIHLNMASANHKEVGRIKNPSSFQIKASKELESLGLFIFKDKKDNQRQTTPMGQQANRPTGQPTGHPPHPRRA